MAAIAEDRILQHEMVRIDPDPALIRSLRRRAGEGYRKCIQCGTCSAACTLSPDPEPFPRKEMAWAVWGMRDRLLESPDVWLCHHCNDCSTRCPRGARPGDVMAAVRQESVLHHAFPRFLGRWLDQPHAVPLLLGIPCVLLTLALVARAPLENALGIGREAGDRIVYSYSSLFPHWLLNTFFGFFSLLALLAVLAGAIRLWNTMKITHPEDGGDGPARGWMASVWAALKRAVAHDDFTRCTEERPRYVSHLLVFLGFLALTVVTLWVITAGVNPLVRGAFVYPFGFWSPWKLLANAGGVALLAGCLLMARDRLRERKHAGHGTYFDWLLLSKLLLVTITGFITEALHYLRLEPHRHIAYFLHLVLVFTVLMYLPYSKLAHMVYRFTAMVFAERTGRNAEVVDSRGRSGTAGA